jgi:glyoxylase-like metal-dependent hydrolase (beta-lactamase superfamily II)
MKHTRLVAHSLVILGSVVLLLAGWARAQQDVDWSAVQIVTRHVAGGVHYLEGRGGNIGLSVGEDGVVMIDDQFAPLTDRIVAAVRQLSQKEIRFLINTHVHPDHTGGNENMGRMGVAILAHDRVRVRLAEGIRGGPPAPAAALPILTYSDTATVHLNGEQVHVFGVPPAHTDGDSFIHFRGSDVLHLGDVFRTVAFPVIDTANGGTLDGTIAALGIAIGLAGPNTKIIPGHGTLSSRADVIEFRDMVLVVKQRMSKLVADGKSYAEVAAARPAAEYEQKWGDPERFLRAVYQQLGGASPG